MLSASRLGAEYRKLLTQTIESRKHYDFLCKELRRYQDLNTESTNCISRLQKTLSDLENDYLKLSPLSESLTVHGDSSVDYDQSTVDRSLTFQRFPTQDSELSPHLQSYIPEMQEEPKLKLFEHFLVVAADPECIETSQIPAQLLFAYPKLGEELQGVCEEINEMVFPDGIVGKLLDDTGNQFDQVSCILYKSRERDCNSFILSFSPGRAEQPYDKSEMVNNQKTHLYCCCLKFEDIAADSFNKQLLSITKCYCLLTYLPCFDLHFEVLYKLLIMLRGKIVEESNYQLTFFEGYSDINLMFRNSGEGLGLLESYYEYYNEAEADVFSDISIYSQTVGSIEYSFPNDFYYLNKKWLCPLMFSMLSVYDFSYLLLAGLTGKSVVFVHSDLDVISSCVLGLQSLLMPLARHKNVFAVVNNKRFLEVAQENEFIVGTCKDEGVAANAVFVVINERENEVSVNGTKVEVRRSLGLTYDVVSKLRGDYVSFNCEHLYRRGEGARKVPVYMQTDEQSQAYEKIVEEVRRFMGWVLGQIKNCCNFSARFVPETVFVNIKKTVSFSNQEFLIEILKTQAFEGYFNMVATG